MTWIDSPNGGHVFSPEKVTYGSERGHELKNLVLGGRIFKFVGVQKLLEET